MQLVSWNIQAEVCTTTTTDLFARKFTSYLEDLVLVGFKRVKLQLQVPQVPKSHSLQVKGGQFSTASRCYFTVTVWKKDTSPYLQSQWQEWTRCKDWKTGSWPQQCGRPLHGWAWRCCWTACPNCSKNRQKHQCQEEMWNWTTTLFLMSHRWGCLHHEFLVICHRSKERFVEKVPWDVLHHSSVACEDSLGIHNLPLFGNCADIPQAYSLQRAQTNVKKERKKRSNKWFVMW